MRQSVVVLVMACLFNASAGEPLTRVLHCSAIVLRPIAKLTITKSSASFAGCTWRVPLVPVTYRLTRETYSVSLLAFDNNSDGLALSAFDSSGRPLAIEGFRFLDAVKLNVPLSFPEGSYRYWILPDWTDHSPITFSVLGVDGRVLGEERMLYRIVSGEKRLVFKGP